MRLCANEKMVVGASGLVVAIMLARLIAHWHGAFGWIEALVAGLSCLTIWFTLRGARLRAHHRPHADAR